MNFDGWTFVSRTSSREVAEEVLDHRVGNVTLRNAIDKWLQTFIGDSQEVFKLSQRALREVLGAYEGGESVSEAELRKVIFDHIVKRSPWGRDRVAPLLAEIVAHGKYVL